MIDCIFCKIAIGEISANKIYEDDNLLAFLDVMPVRPGHALIIPKKHFATILTATDDVSSKIIALSKKIGKKMIEELNADGFNIINNTNSAAGQKIFHVHLHVIPRYENDGLEPWPQKKYNPGQAEDIAAKLKL